jgi:multidrug resistance efflux pump
MNNKTIKRLRAELDRSQAALEAAKQDSKMWMNMYGSAQKQLEATCAHRDELKDKLADANRTLDNVRRVTQLASGLCNTIDSIITKG